MTPKSAQWVMRSCFLGLNLSLVRNGSCMLLLAILSLLTFTPGGFAQQLCSGASVPRVKPAVLASAERNEAEGLDSRRLLMKKNILLPIEKSSAAIEIRIYNSGDGIFLPPCLILRCNGTGFSMDNYRLQYVPSTTPRDRHPTAQWLGPWDSGNEDYQVIMQKSTVNLPGDDLSWQKILDSLDHTGIFSGGGQREMLEAVAKRHPEMSSTKTYDFLVEIKSGPVFRSVLFTKDFAAAPVDVPEYRSYRTLLDLYHTLTNPGKN